MRDEAKPAPEPQVDISLGKHGTTMDIVIAWAAWTLIVGVLLAVVLSFNAPAPNDRTMLILCGVCGGTLGWATGIVLTPYDIGENRTFTGIGKGVYGLVTGYVVAKIDPAITAMVAQAIKGGVPVLAVMAVAISLVSFVAAATVTFVSRKYWREDKVAKRAPDSLG